MVEVWLLAIQLRKERDVYSLITKARAMLRRSDMLKLLSHIRLELKGFPQRRETPLRQDNRIIADKKD
jgi:hypothetical protein